MHMHGGRTPAGPQQARPLDGGTFQANETDPCFGRRGSRRAIDGKGDISRLFDGEGERLLLRRLTVACMDLERCVSSPSLITQG